jgi:hypothetical protein
MAASFDWSSDNHSVKRGALIGNARQMADYYASLARVSSVDICRGDEP